MNVLQFTLGFYSPHWNMVLESFSSVHMVMVSFSLQKCRTTLQLSSGLPSLWIGRACFKVYTLGPAPLPPLEEFLNSYFMIVSSITCDSASIFVTFLNLHHDHKPTFHLLLWFCPFWSGIVGSCTQKVAFVAGHHSADRAQIWQQSALCYNTSARIYGRPGSEEVPLLQLCMKFMSTLF